MTPEQEQQLVEEVAGAYRPPARDTLRDHPAWHDLDAAARARAYELARVNRRIEAALDPDGLSTTARAVLARIAAAV
jgi:hypothetical protein